MTRARERAIKMYWKMAKEKCPFQTEELVNGYLEGFIDCAELFEEEDKLTLTKYARIIIDKKDECIEELEKENAELKSDNDARKFAMAMSEKVEKQLREQIEKMKCCANCKSFKGYGETCEGWGEPVLNLNNCDCTEWELRR